MAHKAHTIWVVMVAALLVDVIFAGLSKLKITVPMFSYK